jgi:AcrR family transcriptional regulator
MADIAERLGTSKAALYYHFKSKEEILDELLAGPAAALDAIASLATQSKPRAEPEQLLGGLIDMFASSNTTASLFGNDASALADYVRRHQPDEKIAQILAALAGRRASTASTIRARRRQGRHHDRNRHRPPPDRTNARRGPRQRPARPHTRPPGRMRLPCAVSGEEGPLRAVGTASARSDGRCAGEAGLAGPVSLSGASPVAGGAARGDGARRR